MSKLTVPQAARHAGRNPETIRRWIRQGKLRSERVGTQYLVAPEDLDAVMSEAPMQLPSQWRQSDHGSMPPWERLVRNGRESH